MFPAWAILSDLISDEISISEMLQCEMHRNNKASLPQSSVIFKVIAALLVIIDLAISTTTKWVLLTMA